jgi:hypothetical protein
MTKTALIKQYWQAILNQDADDLRNFFHHSAIICWHNTNEQFNLDTFIKANCTYPGNWWGVVERIEQLGDLVITVTKVHSDQGLQAHATSFILFEDDKIIRIDEYWGDDGLPPAWRQAFCE